MISVELELLKLGHLLLYALSQYFLLQAVFHKYFLSVLKILGVGVTAEHFLKKAQIRSSLLNGD